MKRIAFLFFFLSFLWLLGGTASKALAQIGEPRSAVAVGFSGGLALNTVGFDPTIKLKQHQGATFGVVARFTSEKYFQTVCALQIELNYALLGWTEEVLDANSKPLPDQYSRNHHYIQLPILARLGWGREYKGCMGYFLAGPQFGYCISENTKRTEFTLNAAGEPDRPNGMFAQYDMPIENKFDYGITAGAGFELSTRAGRFLIEGRYYYGLSDIFKNSKKDTFGRSNNGTIVVKCSYLFDLKH